MPSTASCAPRVLFLNQFFWPDAAPTAVLLDHLARKFVDEGWDVTVVCSQATYVGGDQQDRPSVRILTVPAFRYTRKAVGRLLSWTSFLFLASARCLWQKRFDLVVAMTSPPGIAFAGALLKVIRRSDFWIWEMDVYPDVALELSRTHRRGFIAKTLSRIFREIRSRADGIVVLGPCMRNRLQSHDLNPDRLHVADNWADGDAIRPMPLPKALPINVLYSGNLGLAHDVDTIASVLTRLAESSEHRFTFAGSGARRAQLEAFCVSQNITNVSFGGFASKSGFLSNLASSHIGLLTLRPECVGTVVPSKMYSLLAAGRPFLFIGPKESTPALVAQEGCGWAFDNGDAEGITELLQQLRANPRRIEEAATQARLCFDRSFSRSIGTARVFQALTSSYHRLAQPKREVSSLRRAN